MASPLPLVLVQAPAHPADDTASFLKDVEQLARQRPAARLFVYPELHLCGAVKEAGRGQPLPTPDELAQPSDGQRDKDLASLAGDLGIWLVPGSVYERGADGLVYNTAPVYSPLGRRVASYRKICPWRPFEMVTPGSEFVVFDLPDYGRVGLSICYDAWFPEISRHLAWMGADLILNLVQTPTVDREQEVILARANAIANQVFVASINGAGPTAVGRSGAPDVARPTSTTDRPDMSTTKSTPSTSRRLVPRLGLVSIVVFGLAYMSPSIVVSTFGVIAATSKGTAPTAYLVATVAMTLTALSYGKLARAYPASGSVYTYARRLLDARIGFLAGWALLLDYFFLPMVAWLITALYMNVQFAVLPVWGWLLVLIAVTTLVNVLGIVVADRVNKVLLTLTAIALLALVVVCLHAVGASSAGTAGSSLWNPTTSVGAVTAAAAIAAYSFLGFDAVSTLSEEVVDAERNVPRGILLSVLIGGGIFFVIALLMQWVRPGGAFKDESTAGYAVATLAGGKGFANVYNVLTLIGGLASCVAIQASTSRLMYVMGRDGVLPRRAFGYLHPRFRTPVFNLFLVAAAGLLATRLSLATATSFINFGAFLAFTVVNVCVIAAWIRFRKESGQMSVLGYVVLPVLGATVDVYLITKLGSNAVLLGGGWLVIGIVYLLILTRGLRQAPPELSLDEVSESRSTADAT